jgi:hypothetical protein
MHPIPKARKNGVDLLRQTAQPGSQPAFRAFPCSSLPFLAPVHQI